LASEKLGADQKLDTLIKPPNDTIFFSWSCENLNTDLQCSLQKKKIDISKSARDEQDQYKHANIPFQVSHKQQDSLNADGPYFVTIRGVHRWFQQTVLKTNS
jgi:hypothetical protein